MFMVDASGWSICSFALLITTGFSTVFQYFGMMSACKIGSFYCSTELTCFDSFVVHEHTIRPASTIVYFQSREAQGQISTEEAVEVHMLMEDSGPMKRH